jgi:hypothetical protein
MAEYTKHALSNSIDGMQINVSASATPGTEIHTAISGSSNWDEVWLYATNPTASDVELTIEWGGVTDPDNLTIVTIPSKEGDILVKPGAILQNSKVIRAFCSTGSAINIGGWVNRITEE